MAKIVTMGEIMLRLSTPEHDRIVQADSFDATYAGAEANVAVSLANFGHDAEFVTKLPENAVADAAIAALRKFGVETKHIKRGGERLGIYFLEKGTAIRGSSVVYDRKYSSISEATAADFDFDEIFSDADWFHITGITPALSDSCEELTRKALEAAKKHGVTVSFDINYRKKLWNIEKAEKTLRSLMEYVDVCIGGESVLDISNSMGNKGFFDLTPEDIPKVLKQISEDYGFKYAVTTHRDNYSASDNGWSACIYAKDTDEFAQSRTYRVSPITDRVGVGDSFAGALISGILDKRSLQDTIEFATAASALKHTISGDYNIITRGEAENLAKGDISGKVQR